MKCSTRIAVAAFALLFAIMLVPAYGHPHPVGHGENDSESHEVIIGSLTAEKSRELLKKAYDLVWIKAVESTDLSSLASEYNVDVAS